MKPPKLPVVTDAQVTPPPELELLAEELELLAEEVALELADEPELLAVEEALEDVLELTPELVAVEELLVDSVDVLELLPPAPPLPFGMPPTSNPHPEAA